MNRWRGNGHLYRVPNAAKVDIRIVEKVLTQPLKWREPRRIFVCSMTDLFLDQHTDAMIDRVFAVMALTDGTRANGRHHQFQVLTKRAERMRDYLSDPETPFRVAAEVCQRVVGFRPSKGSCDWSAEKPWPLPNVWLGVSVENQAAADERIPLLLDTPAAIRFLSCEPLLGPITFVDTWLIGNCGGRKPLDWIIIGGESGKNARPMDLSWMRSILAQCATTTAAAAFVKQLGRYPVERTDGFVTWPDVELRDSHGGDMAEWPDDLKVREFPQATAP